MLAGAEAAGRVDFQNGSSGSFRSGCLPAGLDVQLFSHRKGLEVLLPVVGPVLFPDAGALHFQAAVDVFRICRPELCQHIPQGRQCFCALAILREIDGDAGFTVRQFHQAVLQIVPSAVLLLQKFLKVLGILHHAAPDA